jgi:hypothetical protein
METHPRTTFSHYGCGKAIFLFAAEPMFFAVGTIEVLLFADDPQSLAAVLLSRIAQSCRGGAAPSGKFHNSGVPSPQPNQFTKDNSCSCHELVSTLSFFEHQNTIAAARSQLSKAACAAQQSCLGHIPLGLIDEQETCDYRSAHFCFSGLRCRGALRLRGQSRF